MPEHTNQNTQFIIFALTGMFVFGWFIYLIFQYIRRRKKNQASTTLEEKTTSLPSSHNDFNQPKVTAKKIIAIGIFVVVTAVLTASPFLYFRFHSGDWRIRQAVCGTTSPYARNTDLHEVSLHLDYWNNQQVAISGKLIYNRAEETFYLRDGALSVALDVSDCQNLAGFKKTNAVVSVKGVVAKNSGLPLIAITELREIIPGFMQTVAFAGYFCIFILFILVIVGILSLVIKVFVRIGLIKPRHAPSPEELGNKGATILLLYAFFIPLLWFLNPIVGIGFYLFVLIIGWKGLRSSKRKTALVGVILCFAGIVFMTMVTISLGAFENPPFKPFSDLTEVKPTGAEHLELKPYINKKLFFSLHQPKGWTASEEVVPGTNISLPIFKGPEDGLFQEKPFSPDIKVGVLPLASIKAKGLDGVVNYFIKDGEREKSFKLISKERHLLSGGRLEAAILEQTHTKDNIDWHALGLFAVKNNVAYLMISSMPAEKFNHYGSIVRESFATLEIFPDNFASCLKLHGAILYGSYPYNMEPDGGGAWQKKLFAGMEDDLPYVECAASMSKNYWQGACTDRKIESVPAWEFEDGSRLMSGQTLKILAKKTNCPLPR